MKAHEFEVWFDDATLKAGHRMAEEINRGLAWCDYYLPVISRAALESKWCAEEVNAALSLNVESNNLKPRIISILIEDCRNKINARFPSLVARLYVNFTANYDDALHDLLTKDFGVTPPPRVPVMPPPVAPIDPSVITPPPVETRKPTLTMPRDELIHLYNEARASQAAGDLRAARDAFRTIAQAAPDYRDVAERLCKLDWYLDADDAMQKALADPDDKTEFWVDAATRLLALVKLDANFLDAPAKLATAQRGLALAETYERLLDAFDEDDWAKAYPLFEQIRAVKPNYKKTQPLFEKAWSEFVRAGLNRKVNQRDGKEMVWIPAGEFVMESNDGRDNEKPSHKVYLYAFYISRYPVTNAEYKKFVDATRHAPPQHWANGQIPAGCENHPVERVSWDDAVAYCQWAGVRLPTEAEWEKAASWDAAKKIKRVYPWGDTFDANKCNTAESGIKSTTPVGKYSPQGDSAYGVAEMTGNVWEWCADGFDANYYQNSPAQNPQGPVLERYRVFRGGSWYDDGGGARCAYRYCGSHDNNLYNGGFRVAESFPT